jgi:hypothetical protein
MQSKAIITMAMTVGARDTRGFAAVYDEKRATVTLNFLINVFGHYSLLHYIQGKGLAGLARYSID